MSRATRPLPVADDEEAGPLTSPPPRRGCTPSCAAALPAFRSVAAFWLLGLMNNAGYNVSLASANEVGKMEKEGGLGCVVAEGDHFCLIGCPAFRRAHRLSDAL